jgi:serine O-acetyltransferase
VTGADEHPVPAGADVPGAGPAPGLFRQIREDLDAVVARDPSCRSRAEAFLRPPWQGLAVHRMAHRLHRRGFRITAALLTWVGRATSGMELSPGARLGRRLFIDHGFGVVIGEDAVVGDDVTLYHGVTLGSRGWWQDGFPARRHPVIGDRVRIGVNASVLGPVVIGDDCVIRAHELVLSDRERQREPR